MPDIVSLRPTDWIKGVQCYVVTDSTFNPMPAGTRYTISDLHVIGSHVSSTVHMRVMTGNKLGRGPQWSPFTPSVPKRSETMNAETTTATEIDVKAPVKATRKKAARKTAKSSGSATKRSPKKKAAKKAAKGAKKGGAKKATRAQSSNGELKPNQEKMLVALKKGEMTRAQISEKTGIEKGFSALLGKSEDPAADSLKGLGLVKDTPHEGQRGLFYSLTAKGKKVAAKL